MWFMTLERGKDNILRRGIDNNQHRSHNDASER